MEVECGDGGKGGVENGSRGVNKGGVRLGGMGRGNMWGKGGVLTRDGGGGGSG